MAKIDKNTRDIKIADDKANELNINLETLKNSMEDSVAAELKILE